MVLSARGLAGGYGAREVVRGVSLDVPRGCCVAILGPNGAGKSTLLRLLAGILPPTQGTVDLLGTPLAEHTRREAARVIGFVPQSVNFAFPLSVEEVVLQARAAHLGPWRPPGRRDLSLVRRALAQVGLAGREDESVTRLSGGERQRVLLARALAGEPEVLLLDEPAASLDVLHQLDLIAVLARKKAAGTAAVLVAHDWNLALQIADLVLVLRDGATVAQARASDLALPEILAGVFGVRVPTVPGPGGRPLLIPTRRHDRGQSGEGGDGASRP